MPDPATRFSLHRAQQGYVLVVTLWVLVLLGFMVSALSYRVRVETALERRALERSSLRLAARGGVHLAAARLAAHADEDFHDPRAPWWSSPELNRDQAIGEARVSLLREPRGPHDRGYGLDDEESRLNINAAEPEQLMRFPGVSTVLAEALARYRRELQGEQKDNETTQERESDKKNWLDGPIRSLEELLTVEGMSRELLYGDPAGDDDGLAPFLTCASNGRVNVNSAPLPVLVALGLDEGQINTLRSHREQGLAYRSLEQMADALAMDTKGKEWTAMKPFLAVRSETFRVRAQARPAEGGGSASATAGIYLGGDKLIFTRWQEQ
jgi:type II secretory pathway component PulK